MHADEYQLIEVGEKQVPVFVNESEQALTKGIIFIIGDADAPMGKKSSLTSIARIMPQYGWTTVVLPSLSLQSKPKDIPDTQSTSEDSPTEENSAENNNADEQALAESDSAEAQTETNSDDVAKTTEMSTEASSDKVVEKGTLDFSSKYFQEGVSEAQLVIFNKELETYLSIALGHMKNTLGHRIVVSQGVTAASISKLLSDKSPMLSEIDAAVIHSPYWPVRELNNKIPMIVAQSDTPTLDLVSEWDNAWSQHTQHKRKVKARTELKAIYRQVEVIGQPIDEVQSEYIARTIKGWTSYLGW